MFLIVETDAAWRPGFSSARYSAVAPDRAVFPARHSPPTSFHTYFGEVCDIYVPARAQIVAQFIQTLGARRAVRIVTRDEASIMQVERQD
jgi:hypothetical protein